MCDRSWHLASRRSSRPERAEARVGAVCGFAAAARALRGFPCAARSAGRLRQLGPGYRASDTSKSSRSTAPTPLRCAARRRRGAAPAAHPHLCENRLCSSRRRVGSRSSSTRSVVPARPWAGERRSASAAPRSAGDRGLRIAPRRCVERSLSEHRAQAACAAGCRPCEGEFCARPRDTSTAGESARSADRRSEAQPLARPRPCKLRRQRRRARRARRTVSRA